MPLARIAKQPIKCLKLDFLVLKIELRFKEVYQTLSSGPKIDFHFDTTFFLQYLREQHNATILVTIRVKTQRKVFHDLFCFVS